MAIIAGARVRVVAGCKPREVRKNTVWTVLSVTELGPDYSHSVRVVLINHWRKMSWFARHINRLSDTATRLNDGTPTHHISIQEVSNG